MKMDTQTAAKIMMESVKTTRHFILEHTTIQIKSENKIDH